MSSEVKSTAKKQELSKAEITGLVVLVLSLVGLFFNPGFIGGVFDAMVNRANSC